MNTQVKQQKQLCQISDYDLVLAAYIGLNIACSVANIQLPCFAKIQSQTNLRMRLSKVLTSPLPFR